MIIRKPYAFLIKNFRLIHLLMLLFSSYVIYRTNNALQFFNTYVDTRQFIESESLINDTIPLLLVLFSLVLVVMSTSIIVLFKKKDKPILFYLSSIIFYIALIVLCLVSRSIINTIVLEGIDPRVSRIIRDLWLISFIIQVALVAFYLIRTLGFDVKKFHFGEDLHELNIDDEDSEEYELTTRFDRDKLRMNASMRKEELKSFYYENKVIIIVILLILFIVLPSTFIAKKIISNRRYQENETIVLKKYDFKVIDSYVTKKGYNGDILFNGDNSYFIVKFNINNKTNSDVAVNINNLRLEINDNVYIPKTTYYDYFVDIGKGYNSQVINNESKDYIAVYIVKDEDLNNEVIIRFTDKLSVKNNETNANYYRIIASPENLDTKKNVINLNINDYYSDGNVKFKINHYNVKDKYTYEFNNKTKYLVNSSGLILSLEFDFTSDLYENFIDFLKSYGKIRYVIGNRTYNENINNLSPGNYNNLLYLAVNERIKNANSIYLVISLRNKEFLYKLK